jgi:hypothetical protein
MKKIVLISCVSKKLDCRARAKDLYVSPLFRHNLTFARKLSPDKIFILSAKYGLLDPERFIEPYERTLNDMPERELRRWAEKVLADLRKEVDLGKDRVIFLAGIKYRKYLIPAIKNYEIPLEGLPIGKQLSFLKANI